MILEEDKAKIVFRKVRQARDEMKAYCLAPDRLDMSVEDFQRIVGQMYKLTIHKLEVPFEGKHLRGMMERYQDRVVVFIKKNQEEDWKRFVSVKELCHVMNDKEEDLSVDGAFTISSLLAECHNLKDVLANKAVQSEIFAEFAAIEMLYPFECRLHDLTAMNGGKLTTAKIASSHRIPEVIVGRALSDWYHNLTISLWNSLDGMAIPYVYIVGHFENHEHGFTTPGRIVISDNAGKREYPLPIEIATPHLDVRTLVAAGVDPRQAVKIIGSP